MLSTTCRSPHAKFGVIGVIDDRYITHPGRGNTKTIKVDKLILLYNGSSTKTHALVDISGTLINVYHILVTDIAH